MVKNQALSESKSLMAWLDRRIEQVVCPSSVIKYQKKFMEMWKEVFPNEDVPQAYRDKVMKKYEEVKSTNKKQLEG